MTSGHRPLGGPDADGDMGTRRSGSPRSRDQRPQRPSSEHTASPRGSLNVIARRAGVAKGSLFQYFADKRDLYAFIADVGSQRVRAYMEARIRELDPSRPFFAFLTDLLDSWVAYFADHPQERSLHAAASFEVDTDARISVRTVIHRHYLEVLRPLVRDAHARGGSARRQRYRRVAVAAADDLSASRAGALRARHGSDPRA